MNVAEAETIIQRWASRNRPLLAGAQPRIITMAAMWNILNATRNTS